MFHETLQGQIYKSNGTYYLTVSREFNARVVNDAVSGGVGISGEQHSNGDSLLRYTTSND